jgi:hypothetical protein
MKGGESEPHVIYIEIPITGVFPVDHFDGASFVSFSAFVDNEKISTGKDKFFYCPRCPFIVFFRRFLPAAGSFTYTYMILETRSTSLV